LPETGAYEGVERGAQEVSDPGVKPFRLALVSMPWPLFDRPSLQLGALKSYLDGSQGLLVETLHPYLGVAREIGPEAYRWVSKDHWLGEVVYAPMIFEDRYGASKRLFDRRLRDLGVKPQMSYEELHEKARAHLRSWAASIDWGRFDLVGFSVCFNQVFSSLAAAAILKRETRGGVRVLFGGSSCSARAATQLLQGFPQVDFVVAGEGERPLASLCEYLRGSRVELDSQVYSRNDGPVGERPTPSQVQDLGALRPPDYDSYFAEIARVFSTSAPETILPIEFSRGCWWGKCAFCTLNHQWCGYRAKSAGQMYAEVTSLADKHGCLDFAFNDNALPVRESKAFFRLMAEDARDCQFFAETRVEHCGDVLAVCSRGGLRAVQSGIEALSETLLGRMKKGVTVIDNVLALKSAMENDVELDGNLITEFPASGPQDVSETLANLEFVLPFRPLSISPFYLGQGSPIDANRREYGIEAVERHCLAGLFPKGIAADGLLPYLEYRGDKDRQREMWSAVVKKVREWDQFHRGRRTATRARPPLSYRDGGSYLLIRRETLDGRTLRYRLEGAARLAYLSCHRIRTIDQLADGIPDAAKDDLIAFLQDLVGKRLMFHQNGKYLALAIGERGIGAPSRIPVPPALEGQ
jgi:ribosomal peptide maturation radical SAM protein 1